MNRAEQALDAAKKRLADLEPFRDTTPTMDRLRRATERDRDTLEYGVAIKSSEDSWLLAPLLDEYAGCTCGGDLDGDCPAHGVTIRKNVNALFAAPAEQRCDGCGRELAVRDGIAYGTEVRGTGQTYCFGCVIPVEQHRAERHAPGCNWLDDRSPVPACTCGLLSRHTGAAPTTPEATNGN